MEIERKYIPKTLPENLAQYKHHKIEQAYLNTAPVVRIRKQDNEYFLTYKGGGMMAREEYNLPLGAEGYAHLKEKIDGKLISKRRYLIPMENGLTIELDVFYEPCKGLLLAEVEFPDKASANSFCPPAWFGEDVTFDGRYHNSYLSR